MHLRCFKVIHKQIKRNGYYARSLRGNLFPLNPNWSYDLHLPQSRPFIVAEFLFLQTQVQLMLQDSATELLNQLKLIVQKCDDRDFTRALPELSNSTFGQHVRHTLEFFLCLFDANNEGAINYDNRKHDKFIETDPVLAISVIESIQKFLAANTEDFAISFEANYTLEEGVMQKMSSSFYRELAYNIEHAIHHMALLKVAVNQTLSYIELPADFGVATSTIRYQAGTNA